MAFTPEEENKVRGFLSKNSSAAQTGKEIRFLPDGVYPDLKRIGEAVYVPGQISTTGRVSKYSPVTLFHSARRSEMPAAIFDAAVSADDKNTAYVRAVNVSADVGGHHGFPATIEDIASMAGLGQISNGVMAVGRTLVTRTSFYGGPILATGDVDVVSIRTKFLINGATVTVINATNRDIRVAEYDNAGKFSVRIGNNDYMSIETSFVIPAAHSVIMVHNIGGLLYHVSGTVKRVGG